MTRFRPCIDLHEGKVKQIVGSTLDNREDGPVENFVAQQSAAWFATRYAKDELPGGHVIMLGPGNDAAAASALAAFPGGMQIGGGINSANATAWLEAGASHVIVTSWFFDESGHLQPHRLDELVSVVGRERLVIDLSCKRTSDGWTVAMNRWKKLTDVAINVATLDFLSSQCSEFLIHAADVEGLGQGIDVELVQLMGNWAKIPITYAGGVANMNDVDLVKSTSNGQVDVTVGSSLDLFGGSGVSYDELVGWSRRQ